MREIKFRAWNKDTKIMGGGIELKNLVPYNYLEVAPDLQSWVWLQYTGLKTADDNTEIYEGDILEHTSMKGPNETPLRHVVSFSANSLRGASGFVLPVPLHKFKVVGNIYENKDLLYEDN